MIKYIDQERAKWWPVSPELLAQYRRDGSHTKKYYDGRIIWYQNGQWHRDGDKPALIWANGTLYWYQNGQVHRDGDKPAYINANSTLVWFQNGQYHRLHGPAAIRPNGKLDWWINGKEITQEVNEWLNGEEWHGTPEQIFEFQLRFV